MTHLFKILFVIVVLSIHASNIWAAAAADKAETNHTATARPAAAPAVKYPLSMYEKARMAAELKAFKEAAGIFTAHAGDTLGDAARLTLRGFAENSKHTQALDAIELLLNHGTAEDVKVAIETAPFLPRAIYLRLFSLARGIKLVRMPSAAAHQLLKMIANDRGNPYAYQAAYALVYYVPAGADGQARKDGHAALRTIASNPKDPDAYNALYKLLLSSTHTEWALTALGCSIPGSSLSISHHEIPRYDFDKINEENLIDLARHLKWFGNSEHSVHIMQLFKKSPMTAAILAEHGDPITIEHLNNLHGSMQREIQLQLALEYFLWHRAR